MDLFSSDHFHVLIHGEKQHALVFNRIDGTVATLNYEDAIELGNLDKLTTVCGPVIGIYLNSYLVLVKQRSFVGYLYEPVTKTDHEVYAVKNVFILPIFNDKLDLVDTSDCFKKRLVEEMSKLFIDAKSFYFSHTIDLTCAMSKKPMVRTKNEALWKFSDERFFWNRHMLRSLIELDRDNFTDVNYFIVPILHGFIQLENLDVTSMQGAAHSSSPAEASSSSISEQFNSIVDYIDKIKSKTGTTQSGDIKLEQQPERSKSGIKKACQLGLISRRSIHQAGTRYRRRGCDDNGNCANFVETEQLFRYGHHQVSYIIIRGSIPLFWSQPGFKYRPAPVLSRTDEENQSAFSKHFQNLFHFYGTDLTLIDCTEHNGREKIVHEAYKRHFYILQTSQPNINYVEFDFHKHCRGRLLLQVEQHLNKFGINEKMIKDMRYYWQDAHGLICDQVGIIRVNCIDCLDRTNIVQQALGLRVLDVQLTRLGLLSPDTDPEDNKCRKFMQLIWANNGDILSRQYAGSNALKGDFTRTGERKLYGYLKDTYSSASRYYISKFRDAYRQAAINAMLGVESTSLETELETKANSSEIYLRQDSNTKIELDKFEEIDDQERMQSMLDDCKMILIDENPKIVDSWLLFSCDPHQANDLEVLLILTNDSYYIVDYDELAERVNNFQQIKFEDIELIELGISADRSLFSRPTLFQLPQNVPVLRINYRIDIQSGHFHMLRSSNHTSKDAHDYLLSIVDKLKTSLKGMRVEFVFDQKLPRKRSLIPGIINENTSLMMSINNQELTSGDSETGRSSRPWLLAHNLEPIFTKSSRRGTAVLRGVKSQMTRQLAGLKGKFYTGLDYASGTTKDFGVRKSDLERNSHNMNANLLHRSSSDTSLKHLSNTSQSQTFNNVNIDWPSSESVDNLAKTSCLNNLAQVKEDEGSYVDDDYTSEQVMLSIDVAQFQRANSKDEKPDSDSQNERINMTAISGIDIKKTKHQKQNEDDLPVTTSS